MSIGFFPTSLDVDRYRRLRGVSRELNERALKTIPSEAYADIGDALGIRRNGILVFDSEHESAVLADACLYDWYDDEGRNLIERFADAHAHPPSSDESLLLDGFRHALYRLVLLGDRIPGAGFHCEDLLRGREEFFLMDVGLSGSERLTGLILATRTIPLGDYWMTSGAALLVTEDSLLAGSFLHGRTREDRALIDRPGGLPLWIARQCLAEGATGQIVPHTPRVKPKEPKFHFKRRR